VRESPVPRPTRRGLLAGAAGWAAGTWLAGCGSDTGRGGSGGGPALSHWYHQYGEPGVKAAVTRYAREYPKADVRIQWRPGDYDRQTATALLTDVGPDVFETSGPTIDQILAGQVIDLTDVVAPVAGQYAPAVLAQKTHRGRVYAVPQTVDAQLLYYRPSLLAAARVPPPRTLDELVAAARATTTPDVKGLFLGNDGGAGALGATPLRAAGLSQVSAEGTVGFADPAAAAALAKLRTLYAEGSLLLGAPGDWSNPAAFIQGLTAMQWTGLWALPQIVGAFGEDVGVLPFPPDGPRGRPTVPVGAYACAVSGRSARVPLAVDYVRWLWVDRVDLQLDFAQSYGLHLPARAPLIGRAGRLGSSPAAEAVRLAGAHGETDPLLWTARSRTALQDALVRIIQGGSDPAAEVAATAELVRAELDRVRG
jgi:multiple sugar transport system substrate-binding protein